MKKIILILCLFIYSAVLLAQIKVYPAQDLPEEKEGVFYYLPKTAITAKITIQHKQNFNGPYAKYARSLLGLSNVINSKTSQYSIIDVSLDKFQYADEDHLYFVEYIKEEDSKQKDKKPNRLLLSLNESGFLSFNEQSADQNPLNNNFDNSKTNYENHSEFTENLFKRKEAASTKMKIDTIRKVVFIDSALVERITYKKSVSERTEREMAIDIVAKIDDIDVQIYNLLTGYQEVAYNGSSMRYMHEELLKMKDEYLSLFKGVSITTSRSYTYVFVPEKGKAVGAFTKFSKSQGISKNVSGQIACRILPFSSKKNKDYLNNSMGYYYRIPKLAKVIVEFDNEILIESVMLINQLGFISQLPIGIEKTEVEFHPKVGVVRKINIE